jgi:flagellar basal body-associated protein FliL
MLMGGPVPLFELRTFITTVAFVTAFAIMPVGSGSAADESKATEKNGPAEQTVKTDSDGRLSANEYFTMAPFVVPIIKNGEHHKQFTLIFAIELEDEDHREDLRRLSPRMRNEIYEMLFKVISFRTVKPRIPGNDILRAQVTKVAQRVAGEKIVKTIYVHTADVTDIR